MESINETPNKKTKQLFAKISKIVYYMGAPNLWYEDNLKLSPLGLKLHDFAAALVDFTQFLLIIAQYAALYTQKNLSQKQNNDLRLFCFNQLMFYSYPISMRYFKEKLRYVYLNLTGTTNEIYCDLAVEAQMIKKLKLITFGLTIVMCTLNLLYGLDAFVTAMKGGTFTTMVTAWPEVHDTSRAAGVARVIIYLLWGFALIRSLATYIIVIPTIICLGHQFMQVQSYFKNLQRIFEMKNLSQEEKEKKYEDDFITGIKLHSETFACTEKCQMVGNIVYGVAIVVNIVALTLVMTQMRNAERTITNTMSTLITGAYLLITTACFMGTAGDVTNEASLIANAMYCSGWHLCRKRAAARIRPLLVIAMARSQTPVVMRCLGIVTLSYDSYVTIVKASYSVFSLFY